MDGLQQNALFIFTQDWSKFKEIKLHLKGTDFQLKVWEALLKIPMGGLTTYGDIAPEYLLIQTSFGQIYAEAESRTNLFVLPRRNSICDTNVANITISFFLIESSISRLRQVQGNQ